MLRITLRCRIFVLLVFCFFKTINAICEIHLVESEEFLIIKPVDDNLNFSTRISLNQFKVYTDHARDTGHELGQSYYNLTSYEHRWGQLGFGIWFGNDFANWIYEGYSLQLGILWWWSTATSVRSWEVLQNQTAVLLNVRTNDPFGGCINVTLSKFDSQGGFTAELTAYGGAASWANRVGWGFSAVTDLGREDHPEKYFGFGERYNAVHQQNNSLYCYVEEGGFGFTLPFLDRNRFPTWDTETYMPVPLMISNYGYGVYLNTSVRSNWDFKSNGFNFQVESSAFEMRVLLGGTPADVLTEYTARAGRSLVPPLFQFGPWVSFRIPNLNLTKLEILELYVDNDIPYSILKTVLHYFPRGIKEDGNHDQILKLNDKYKYYGLKPIAYINSMIDLTSQPYFDFALQHNFFVKNQWKNTYYEFSYKGAGISPFNVALLDFTNPEAVAFFQNRMQTILDAGFEGFIYDYGEYLDSHTWLYSGERGYQAHNAYPLMYQQVAYDFFAEKDDDPNDVYAPPYVYIARSGYGGTPQYPGTQQLAWAHWTGDPMSDWSIASGLPAQVTAVLNAGISGIPFIGSDIGGFVWVYPPKLELWVRWAQFGLFSGIMKLQAGGTGILNKKKTSLLDTQEGLSIWRKLSKMRIALVPYMYAAAHEAALTGLPLTRHHLLSFPWDEMAVSQKYQYCFGPSLLVAPVLRKNRRLQSVYLPIYEGKWIDVSTNLQFIDSHGAFLIGSSQFQDGGKQLSVSAPLEDIPFFVKAGTILVTLDPSIDTLNSAPHPDVVGLDEKEDILHLWVWPDENCTARGSHWDGATFEIGPHGAIPSSTQNSTTFVSASALCLYALEADKPCSCPHGMYFEAKDPLRRKLTVQVANALGPAPIISNIKSYIDHTDDIFQEITNGTDDYIWTSILEQNESTASQIAYNYDQGTLLMFLQKDAWSNTNMSLTVSFLKEPS